MMKVMENYQSSLSIFFGGHKFFEYILLEVNFQFLTSILLLRFCVLKVYERNMIRINIDYVFYWGKQMFTLEFLQNIHYTMRIYAITNPRNDT